MGPFQVFQLAARYCPILNLCWRFIFPQPWWTYFTVLLSGYRLRCFTVERPTVRSSEAEMDRRNHRSSPSSSQVPSRYPPSSTSSSQYAPMGHYEPYRYVPAPSSRSSSATPPSTLRPLAIGNLGRDESQYSTATTRSPYVHPLAYSTTLGDQPVYTTASSWSAYPAASDSMLLPPASPYLTSPYGTSAPWSSPPQLTYSGESSPTVWSMPTSAGPSASIQAPHDDFADSSSLSSDTDISRDIAVDQGFAAQQYRPHRCDVCHKSYSRLNNLRTHQDRRHNPNARRFACDWPNCSSHFSRPQDLARHQDSVSSTADQDWR